MTIATPTFDVAIIRDRRAMVLTLLYALYPKAMVRRTLKNQVSHLYGQDLRRELRRDLAYLEESGLLRSRDRRQKWRFGAVCITPAGIDVVEGARAIPGVGPDVRSP